MLEKKEKDKKLFMYLVNTFQSSAKIAMGEMKNPVTEKIETNLNQASYYIDLLEMVQKKTKNNLSDYEEQMLINIISDLRMSYLLKVKN
tara:strand:+ start:326 stop:592 length:267 start_codon:yes stop_codon:yes gene_type:complete